MEITEQLALEHLRRRPEAAARVLESLPEAECGMILAAAPAEVSAGVLAHMLPDFAGRCARMLNREQLCAIVAQCSYQQAMPLLRALPGNQREALLAALELPRASALKLLLHYPVTAVGAHMQPDAVALRPGLSVAEARQRMRQSSGTVGTRVFLLNDEHQVTDAVPLARLLTAPRDSTLSAIGVGKPAVFPARSILTDAATASEWRDYHEMPVINREGRFVGILQFSAIYPLLATTARPPAAAERQEEASLADIFVAGSAGLWQTWLDLLTSESSKERESHGG